jgi:membrane dipeptidase
MNSPERLIDLHCDWLLQYAQETTVFDAPLYTGVSERLGQIEGYLQSTRAAVLACYRRTEEWARRTDPWAALHELIARIESEFPGRLLIGSDDHRSWLEDSDGLCWGVIGVEGFDPLIRMPADLNHLPALFARGVRVFQPSYSSRSVLAGSSEPGDNRGVTDLGYAFFQCLYDLVSTTEDPRPVLDLAHLNPTAMSDALSWFEDEDARAARVIPAYTHGAIAHEGFDGPRALTLENLKRLRALGGYVGMSVSPPFFTAPDSVRACLETATSFPYRGQPGFDGLAIGTDFLGVGQTLPGLGTAEEVVSWLFETFDVPTAQSLTRNNARELVRAVTGAVAPSKPLTGDEGEGSRSRLT